MKLLRTYISIPVTPAQKAAYKKKARRVGGMTTLFKLQNPDVFNTDTPTTKKEKDDETKKK